MAQKKALLRKVAKDYLVIDKKGAIVGKAKLRGKKCYFRSHKDAWIDHDTMHYINLLLWQLKKYNEQGTLDMDVTGFEQGLHTYIRDQVALRKAKGGNNYAKNKSE